MVEVKDATFWEEKEKVEANNKRLSMEVSFHSLLSRINRKVFNFDLSNTELIDIKQNIEKIDNLLDDFCALNEEVKGLFGDEYDAKFYKDFTVTSTKTEVTKNSANLVHRKLSPIN